MRRSPLVRHCSLIIHWTHYEQKSKWSKSVQQNQRYHIIYFAHSFQNLVPTLPTMQLLQYNFLRPVNTLWCLKLVESPFNNLCGSTVTMIPSKKKHCHNRNIIWCYDALKSYCDMFRLYVDTLYLDICKFQEMFLTKYRDINIAKIS